MATMVLIPGSHEPEPDENEIARGFTDISSYLELHAGGVEKVRDAGRAIIEIEECGVRKGIGHIASSAHITPQCTQPQEISPGVYYF